MHEGGCLCGDVRYRTHAALRDVVYCHCEQCRRTSGHFVAATSVPVEDLEITEDRGLAWYRSSDIAERGFCRTCGASVFWQPAHRDYVAIMAGTLDLPTGLASKEHIWTGSKADYYAIDDGLPTFDRDHQGLWEQDGA